MSSRTDRSKAGKNRLERELLSRVAGRDRDALAQLYRLYHPRLFKFIFRMTRSHAATDELVNDIMLTVWKKADSFRGDSKVSTWIFGIAYRQTLRCLSRKQLAIAPNVELDELSAEQAHSLEREDWIKRGLQCLPDAQQLAVVLVFYLGLSYEEIAEVTSCPVNTVKTRMFHARRKLKARLETLAAPESEGGPR